MESFFRILQEIVLNVSSFSTSRKMKNALMLVALQILRAKAAKAVVHAGMADKNFSSESLKIPYEKKQIDACISRPRTGDGTDPCCIILTHGAGGDMDLPQLVLLTDRLVPQGYTVLRFTCRGLNLAYRVKVYTAVLKYVHEKYPCLKGCFLGGRSMGARAAVATYDAIQGTLLQDFVKGIICLSYPLHKPADTGNLRDTPLQNTAIPTVFVSGTRDAMCQKSLMDGVLKQMVAADMLWLDNGDHSLKVKGQTEVEVVETVSGFLCQWCSKILTANQTDPPRKRQKKT